MDIEYLKKEKELLDNPSSSPRSLLEKAKVPKKYESGKLYMTFFPYNTLTEGTTIRENGYSKTKIEESKFKFLFSHFSLTKHTMQLYWLKSLE